MIEPETGLRTGQLAARAGINIQTLRYYERRRLLAPPVRRPSGQRTYPETAVALLRCIKGAQRLGFTLTEIEDLHARRHIYGDAGWKPACKCTPRSTRSRS